uniref:Uncharacterized protein n=1 Tax=Phyllostachys edulis TaxID=38705 RepID=D3IVF6_PHYED|nr:hypothetical protein [Phyllostachys edulis]
MALVCHEDFGHDIVDDLWGLVWITEDFRLALSPTTSSGWFPRTSLGWRRGVLGRSDVQRPLRVRTSQTPEWSSQTSREVCAVHRDVLLGRPGKSLRTSQKS